jgi:scyllo-inositol 2-dehydrogenase (NADP+)
VNTTPFSIAIVGFGRIGAEHATWISSSEHLKVASVFDPTPARRDIARSRGFGAHDSLEAVLGDSDVDAVLISTPTSMHFEHASAALDAGKHVMVEKPATLDAATTQALIGLAAKRHRTLSVFHCRRWDLDYLSVAAAIQSGVLGRVFNVESRLGQWASCVGPAAKEFRPGWRNEASFGGGGLYDWGSHFIDQLWQLMLPARPVRVLAQLRGNVWTQDCDDFARVLIDFDNGATGLCEINTTTTRPLPRWHLDGTLGSLDGPHSPTFDTREWAKLNVALADGSRSSTPAPATAGLTETQIWEAFAIAARQVTDPPVTMSSVLTTMRLLDGARKSSTSGQAIAV